MITPPSPAAPAHRNKSGSLPPTAEVEAIDKIVFRGNIICHSWYLHLRTDAGNTDAIGCLLLAEIVYWYRGSDDIHDGKVVGRYRRFHADFLQKSYGDFAEKFGLTKRQIAAAMVRLEKKGLIKRIFRTITVRGMKCSNVLFIQPFPDKIKEISFFPSEHHTCDQKMAEGGSTQKTEEVSPDNGGGVTDSRRRGDEIPPDKYTDQPTEDLRNYFTQSSTTASTGMPGEPASQKLSDFKEAGKGNIENPGKSIFAPGFENDRSDPQMFATSDTPAPGEKNYETIRRTLEQAFGGQKFTSHGKRKLQELIDENRITKAWAEAFAEAKTLFDLNRASFKTKKLFIPVQPHYLFTHFDLTATAILEILGEQYQTLEGLMNGFDEKQFKESQRTLDRYDVYFKGSGCLDPGYEMWVKEYPGRHEIVSQVFRNHGYYPNQQLEDAIPPAWMKIHYAWAKNIYSFPDIRAAFLVEAQREIQKYPICLKLEGSSLTDFEIQELFGLDYSEVMQEWQRHFNDIDRQMEKLERLITEVANCSAAVSI